MGFPEPAMRCVRGFVAFLLCASAPALAQDRKEPTRGELLAAFEKQLKTTAATAGPSIACVVASRSEHYPKPKPARGVEEAPGRLGGFDRGEFLKADSSPGREALARHLDLSDTASIPEHGYAGGIVIDESGLVLTPYHAIEGATKVYVHLPGGAGSYADIHAADARSDLAVLKLVKPPHKLTALKFADVRLHDRGERKATVFPGKLVVLMANPYASGFKLNEPAAAFGSLTALREPPTANEQGANKNYYKFGPLLEHDVRPNAGVTGGALLNLSGELVGLATAGVVANRDTGPGYAIPADANFRRIVEVLRRGEEVEYGFLGVNIPNPLPPAGNGILISRAVPGQPADRAGIRSGDVITRIDGAPVRNYEDLLLYIGQSLAGSKVKMVVQRGNRERDVEVTLAKFRHELPTIASARPAPVFGLRVDYTSVLAQRVNESEFPRGGLPSGVSVRELIPDSPAAAKFKTLGDPPKSWLVITQVNGTDVSNPAEFYKAARGKDRVKLTVVDSSEREHELILP